MNMIKHGVWNTHSGIWNTYSRLTSVSPFLCLICPSLMGYGICMVGYKGIYKVSKFFAVTELIFLYKGAVTHEDFEGHKGTIEAGDFQWMTAGRGIVHSEIHVAQGTQRRWRLVAHANAKSKSEKFPPPHQDGTLGYPMGSTHHMDPLFDPPAVTSAEPSPTAPKDLTSKMQSEGESTGSLG
ncbi:RmlC-like cupin domain superfamily [Sesbania bispinosa]|nr:RmlC-like cupin domain superfamily [Sesbania bispinosa]